MVKTIINHFYKDKFIFFTGAKEGYKKKPEPDLINLALDTLKMRIEDTIYICDSKYDILIARNLKMDSIIVSYGYGKKEDLLSYNPSIIIDNPLDILIYL